MNSFLHDQPAPTTNHHPSIWEVIIQEMAQRDQVGRARYGTPLQPFNGRDALRDAYCEALDLLAYLRQKIHEEDNVRITEVFLDMDGVLVDFQGPALALHDATLACAIPGCWHMEKWLGISVKDFWAPIRGHAFWAELPWMPDGRHILRLLSGLDPARLHLLSSPSKDPGCLTGKYAWVEREMPTFSRKLHLSPEKTVAAAPGKLLIDDSDEHVTKWRAKGGKAILVPRLWNAGHADSHRALEVVFQEVQKLNLEMNHG